MDYSWIAGDDPTVNHESPVVGTGCGEVHKMTRLKKPGVISPFEFKNDCKKFGIITCSNQRKEVFARKVLRAIGLTSPKAIATQVRVINTLSVSGHKNLLKVLNHGWLPKSSFYFFDMEFCAESLDHTIHKGDTQFLHLIRSGAKKVDISKRVRFTFRIARQIVDGLAFIHHSGEIHRNLKPSNVLYSLKDRLWKLTDYGFMAEDSSGISMKIPDIMAPVYRAPELIPKPQSFDNKIDIWAFGCVLFEMTTQRHAFNGEGEIRTFMARPEKIKVFELDRDDVNEDMVTSAKLAEGLINEMLQVDFNRRPSVDSVLKKIDTCIYLKKCFNRT